MDDRHFTDEAAELGIFGEPAKTFLMGVDIGSLFAQIASGAVARFR